MGKINQEQRAGIAWNVLTRVAEEKSLIRYKDLAEHIGIHYRPLRFVLDKIYDYCEDMDLPPLSILVINAKGIPGSGFMDSYPNSIEYGNQSVYEYDWSQIENPFSYSMDGTEEMELVEWIISQPDKSKEVWTKVKVRGKAHLMFREVLLKIYEKKCAICDTSIYELLEACHIIPWSECSEHDKMNPRNGLLLCANHHKLFDYGYLFIENDYRITLYDPSEINEGHIDFLKLFENKKIRLPNREDLKPRIDYLMMHKNKFS